MDYNFLRVLEEVIEKRRCDKPEDSYVARLSDKGIDKIAQKVGEEGVEVVIAALKETDERFVSESADLIFHLLILLHEKNISFAEIITELEERHKKYNLTK